jgi:carbon-monoxide dehydrogenase small subunit
VVLDGKALSACLTLAVFADGTDITTVEGLARDRQLDPVQQAFIDAGAFQCGFCTPGFVLMTKLLLEMNPIPDDDEIRHYSAGNLCRCGAYPQIVEAVRMLSKGIVTVTGSGRRV